MKFCPSCGYQLRERDWYGRCPIHGEVGLKSTQTLLLVKRRSQDE